FRNATRIQEFGGPAREVLHPVQPMTPPPGTSGPEAVREAVRRGNMTKAERTYVGLAQTADDALNAALCSVEDGAEVHRVVLPYRAWDLMKIIGRRQAHTLLRQSIRYCLRGDRNHYRRDQTGIETMWARRRGEVGLVGGALGAGLPEHLWVEDLSMTICRGTPEQAAGAAASGLAGGMAPAAVGEAISLAANQLILRDNGR